MPIAKTQCKHYATTKSAAPRVAACEVCGLAAPLRHCMECGHVGCCESAGSHAKAHALSAKHPLIRQMPVEAASFTWCYECGDYLV